MNSQELALRCRHGLHACGDKLTLVTNAVVGALVGVVGTLAAHVATPVDIARNDSLHTNIVSVESNAVSVETTL